MYAIVKTGGKQYRVEPGQTLLVERLPQAEGETVSLEPLLVRSEEAIFDAAGLAKVEVQATIVGHLRGKKLRVFKFKPKRGYRRRTGHRQELTRIEVTHIGSATAPRAAAKPAAEPKPAAAAHAPAEATAKAAAEVTAKPVAAHKPAAKPEAEAAGAGTAATAKPKAAAKADANSAAAPKATATRKPAATPKAPAARKPAARSKQAAPAEPDAAPSKEDSDGS
jgi:large subunit ribosomal protein L21